MTADEAEELEISAAVFHAWLIKDTDLGNLLIAAGNTQGEGVVSSNPAAPTIFRVYLFL